MQDYHEVDAQELWQIINLYAGGGYVIEIGNVVAEGSTEVQPDRFWAMDEHGNHAAAWYPEPLEMEALVKEGLIQADHWRPTDHHNEVVRRYELTEEGRRTAGMDENGVLAYFLERGIREHETGQITWKVLP